ncbi:Glycogen debranching enzyme [Marinomonas gallaica]|uniref:Glycogen debranching enzyme n=1 Tax=Marinomonas gallaica TaxID=1806667 RepID=A0A1C3JQR1_9GAMM|nr:glycogen debranching protein GlgX [Marinomonas gallaica]SBT17456.1 Glycogen debranching enzyme [Marinomonas gallaica]SBT19648.1 Glycogen debranching enzyme [Marinomonas gallaica]
MTRNWHTQEGFPLPLGATVTPGGVNFAVFSEHAERLYLCLYNEAGDELSRLPFTHKQRGIWHMEVLDVHEGQHYGLRAEGPFDLEAMHLFNPSKLLIDPYAKRLSSRLVFHDEQITLTPNGQLDSRDSGACVPKAIVTTPSPSKHSLTAKPKASARSLYEMHIKGFSQQLDINASLQGTYLGACSESAINHLTSLGISTIQLMPCFAFADEIHLQDKGLSNYWGYNPINFFTPDDRYAISDAVEEFKTMVATFHKAGFEVILDVVYNHTAESELTHGTTCYRGLDNSNYYRHSQGQYLNFTGCGNCVDTYHPATVRLVCDSMRYWVETMGVDGFRFDLGVDLGREHHDFSPNAPLLQAILQDPILSETTLVMEPWDIGPNGYQVGHFPRGFIECNDKYRDTIRRFWRGDANTIQEFATRLMGSRDLFHKGHKCALHSVNYITYHDGYTLRDLVSYHRRHNVDNRENNRDGHTDNISQNFGVEGETNDVRIREARLTQQKCFMATLLFSQGTPHILGGDELSHSQNGNNNAYCQDNEITWLGWHDSEERQVLSHLISEALSLRQQYPVLAEALLPDDPLYRHKTADDIGWFNEFGQSMSLDDWQHPERDYLSVQMTESSSNTKLWLVFYREDQPIKVRTPDGYEIKSVLFCTDNNVQTQQNEFELTRRSVLLIELTS